MNEQNEALTISNPRLLSAVYFSLLSIIATIIIDSIFYMMGVEQVLPLWQGILLAVVLAGGFGALFGEKIVHSRAPYREHVFWFGFLMVLLALPIYDLVLLFLLKNQGNSLFTRASSSDLVSLYFFLLLYSAILVGIWLALLAGFAAIFLRGSLVIYLLNSLYERPQALKDRAVVKTKTTVHGDSTISFPHHPKD